MLEFDEFREIKEKPVREALERFYWLFFFTWFAIFMIGIVEYGSIRDLAHKSYQKTMEAQRRTNAIQDYCVAEIVRLITPPPPLPQKECKKFCKDADTQREN